MNSTTPNASLLNPNSRREAARCGATLLVTLGILTVLSVMAVAFLITSRLQRQTATREHNRLAARNHIDESIYLAMRYIEQSVTYPSYVENGDPSALNQTRQRVSPVNHWFSQDFIRNNNFSTKYQWYSGVDVLASPIVSNAPPPVNLITREVRSLVPENLSKNHVLSGWLPLEIPSDDSESLEKRFTWFRDEKQPERIDEKPSINWQLRNVKARVAFTVFNCSGFYDANYYVSGPTTQKLQRTVFSQADVTNWLYSAKSKGVLDKLTDIVDPSRPETIPFSSLSYDPDPDADPFNPGSGAPNTYLGLNSFPSPPLPLGASVTKQPTFPRKFAINSVTNLIGSAASESGDWLMSVALMGDWLRPVASALSRANANEPNANPDKLTLLQSVSVPWNLLNFIDADRIPQLSMFANIPDSIERIATRANLAVEDVPLINKVTVFDIGEAPAGHTAAYYGIDNYAAPGVYAEGKVSNHYAVAIELWYPFAPAPLPPGSAFYAVLSTNAADTATTTNRPLTSAEMRDWFRWNEAATSNTVMQTLFYAWANAYTNAVGPAIWNHPLWQIVTTNADAWFTTNMVNHPSWPIPDETGHISITNTPIWQAFYPDTYGIVTTNQYEEVVTNETATIISTNVIDVVTTNFFTYADATNSYVETIEPDGSTNRLTGYIGTWSPEPYPVLLWTNLTSSASTTNVLGGIIDENGELLLFVNPPQTNEVLMITATTGSVYVVVSNVVAGTVTTNRATAFYQAPADTNALSFVLSTNVVFTTTEVTPIPPLPMPADLGDTLDALFGILLAPELSLDTSDELYNFLMRLPSDFDWDFLGGYLVQYPFIQQTIMPSVSRPRTDNLLPEDRIVLTDDTFPQPMFIGKEFDGKKETVAQIFDKISPPLTGNTFKPINDDRGFGTFITVYPHKTVSFPEATIPMKDDGVTPDPDAVATTNYYALGSKSDYVLFFRPVVTLDDTKGTSLTAAPTADGTTVDILDEALLVSGNVFPFHSTTNICVADPRHNAYIQCWRGFPNLMYPNDPPDWDNAIGTTNLSTEVHEYPFIHFNAPFSSIGDIGHVYTSPDRLNLFGLSDTDAAVFSETASLHDTVSFASRPGAVLLDLFTVHATPSNLPPWQTGVPWRGLVQANTEYSPVIQTLFSDATLGWTNANATGNQQLTTLGKTDIQAFFQAYSNALVTTPPVGIGWRSFADMLPSISTNKWLQTLSAPPISDAPAHDWIEDALRRIPDKVSFRQNIFVIVVAAQALSPASTDERPIVLSDQRAAVTVIRDAYTGRWVIHSWVWLTE